VVIKEYLALSFCSSVCGRMPAAARGCRCCAAAAAEVTASRIRIIPWAARPRASSRHPVHPVVERETWCLVGLSRRIPWPGHTRGSRLPCGCGRATFPEGGRGMAGRVYICPLSSRCWWEFPRHFAHPPAQLLTNPEEQQPQKKHNRRQRPPLSTPVCTHHHPLSASRTRYKAPYLHNQHGQKQDGRRRRRADPHGSRSWGEYLTLFPPSIPN
jgi:hypothetical protein